MTHTSSDQTPKKPQSIPPTPVVPTGKEASTSPKASSASALDETGSILLEMERILDDTRKIAPRLAKEPQEGQTSNSDLRMLLDIALAINATGHLEDTLQKVMKYAIDLLGAERGFIMLLDDFGQLQFKTAYNLRQEDLHGEEFRISNSIATQVARGGRSIFTSDAQIDERFAKHASVQELHLRSVMCVPLKLKNTVIGVIYLDNSRLAKHFLKSDLFIFQLLAGLASSAIHNATLYDHLLDLKAFTEKVVNRSPVGILVIDGKYQLVSINDAALEIFDRNKREIRLVTDAEAPTQFFDMAPQGESQKWRQMIDIAFTSRQPFEDSRYFHNTGYVEKALTVKLSPISKLPLGGDGLIIIVEDITEKVIMEKYVILSEKLVARGEMAASIGHEMNNYLTIIGNNAELMNRNLASGKTDKVEFNAKQISEGILKMKRFTDGLMDFSKLDGDFIVYDFKHLIEDLLFSLRAQSRFKEILFTVDMAAGIPQVMMDVGQIQQIFLNLFNNAADILEDRQAQEKAKAEREGRPSEYEKRIGVTARMLDEKTIIVEVSDNALGVDPDTLTKLFQPHFTTKKTGHGLGLSNCRKIAQRHDGALSVRSTVGEGTVFILTLPLTPSQPAQTAD